MATNAVRDELLRRLSHYEHELAQLDSQLEAISKDFPQAAVLRELHGIGLYGALLIVGEIGEPWRLADGRKVGAYAGLTARVSHRQGSPWLRWMLVQAAIKIVRKDEQLARFHHRVRKRSSAQIARVAVARKLASIYWIRLMR